MSKKVYKYEIPAEDTFTMGLPAGSQVLTIQMQHGKPYIWVLLNDQDEWEERRFRLAGTGHIIDEENLDYVGTFQMHGGNLGFHLFEIIT